MYIFYNGLSEKEILKLLIKKARLDNLLVNVLCSNLLKAESVSTDLWNASLPNHIDGDPFFEKNKVFVSLREVPCDVIIILEGVIDFKPLSGSKKCLIGNHEGFDLTNLVDTNQYWLYQRNKWQRVDRNKYYSSF